METLIRTETKAPPAGGNAAKVEPTPAQNPQSPAVVERLKTEGRARAGANWFFWIAALSVINSVMTTAGTEWGFIIGLGVTQLIDAIGVELGASGITLVLSVIAAGTFALFGVFAHKRQNWSYVAGMVLYALDGLLFLVVGDILSVGFHAFVLFWIFSGYQASKKLATQTVRSV